MTLLQQTISCFDVYLCSMRSIKILNNATDETQALLKNIFQPKICRYEIFQKSQTLLSKHLSMNIFLYLRIRACKSWKFHPWLRLKNHLTFWSLWKKIYVSQHTRINYSIFYLRSCNGRVFLFSLDCIEKIFYFIPRMFYNQKDPIYILAQERQWEIFA